VNTDKNSAPEPQKQEHYPLFLYLGLALGVPLSLPLLAVVLQTVVWHFAVSQYPGVTYRFSFVEGLLFSSVVSCSVFLLNTLLYVSKNGFEIPKTAQPEALKEASPPAAKPIKQVIRENLESFAQHFAFVFIVISILSAHFPGKLWFDGVAPMVLSAFTFAFVRLLFYLVMVAVFTRLNEHIKLHKEQVELEYSRKS
jgi:hypothetical protein